MRRRVSFVVLGRLDDFVEHSGTDGGCCRFAPPLLNTSGAVVLQHREGTLGGTGTSGVLRDRVANNGSLATARAGRVRTTAEWATGFANFYEHPVAVVAF